MPRLRHHITPSEEKGEVATSFTCPQKGDGGRGQEEFIRAYGERVIPKLRWPGE